jgi:hypothetical protein
MIEPSLLDVKSLPSVPLGNKQKLPLQSGIYFAIDSNDTIQYIGMSKNIRFRWEQHHKLKELKQMQGIRISYLIMEDFALLPQVEQALITWFKPLLNQTLPLHDGNKKASKKEPSSNYFPDLIRSRLDDQNLTVYGAAQLLAAETDESVKTCHDRISGLLKGRGIAPDKLQEIVIALGGNIAIIWKD